LVSIEDDEFVKELTRKINDLEQQAKSKEQAILASLKI
jgi:formiminotetrahydrofolate cyclodeaminase